MLVTVPTKRVGEYLEQYQQNELELLVRVPTKREYNSTTKRVREYL